VLGRRLDEEEQPDHRRVGDRVEGVDDARAADGDQHAGEAGADQDRDLAARVHQRERLRELPGRDHRPDQGRPGRVVEGGRAHGEQGRQDDVPRLDVVGEGEHGQRQRDHAAGSLGELEQAAAVHPVGERPAHRAEHHHRDPAGSADQAGCRERAGQVVDLVEARRHRTAGPDLGEDDAEEVVDEGSVAQHLGDVQCGPSDQERGVT